MKTMYIAYGIQFIFGCLFYLLIALWVTSILYVGDALGWARNPTLNDEKLLFQLLLSVISSVVYISAFVLLHRFFKRRSTVPFYNLFGFLSWLIGFLGFLSFMFLT
ncbi:hypothetical protein [Halobacillus andaensis]|uniref:hypothetical protein n=1 Tax=Halobacillus andaensis TaxID=1176239 RepID=UPI00166744AB|nr:hypothetical protein [Halobacillus andaensis]MBP2003927.1 hypothetical protein [Halobacillus andaensis]